MGVFDGLERPVSALAAMPGEKYESLVSSLTEIFLQPVQDVRFRQQHLLILAGLNIVIRIHLELIPESLQIMLDARQWGAFLRRDLISLPPLAFVR